MGKFAAKFLTSKRHFSPLRPSMALNLLNPALPYKKRCRAVLLVTLCTQKVRDRNFFSRGTQV